MTLPILDKTWEINPNIAASGATEQLSFASLVWEIKNSLIGNGSPAFIAPWVVRASSDSATATTADHWATSASLTWANAGVAHSWIVLRQTGILSTFDICLDCTPGVQNNKYMGLFVAPNGYDLTGLVTTNRPGTLVGSDEITLYPGTASSESYLLENIGSAFSCKVQACMSNDGAVTRVYALYNGGCRLQWAFEVPKNPIVEWTNPWIAWARAFGGVQLNYAGLNDDAFSTKSRLPDGLAGTAVSFYNSCEGYGAAMIGQNISIANELNSAYPMAPMGLACGSVGFRGRHGERFDYWFGSTAVGIGSHFPDSGTLKQFVQIHDVIQPWDSLTQIQTS